ncbi:MAG: NAD-dependent epimerase/dehydratase family protein [Tsuneonella sp.]
MSQANAAGPWIIVGGASRAGKALAARLTQEAVIPVVRSPSGLPREVVVTAYDTVPDDVSLTGATIVVCAGTPLGSADELQRANCAVPIAWARQALVQGATRLIQISSFSVFGGATLIDDTSPLAPTSGYGHSKLAAEQALAASGLGERLTILRVPILIGGGEDKLAQLTGLVRRSGIIPAAPYPTPRSMLSYDALAATILRVRREALGGRRFAADLVPFTPDLMAQRASALRISTRKIRIPGAALAIVRRAAPGLHSSLFMPNVLDEKVNLVPSDENYENIEAVLDRLLKA